MATSTGARRWKRVHRCTALCGPEPSRPASRQTCSEAVEHIMVRPAGPDRSKCCSMAAYRDSYKLRTDGRNPSRASGLKVRPAALKCPSIVFTSARMASIRDGRSGPQAELTSSWPPGSKVTAAPWGSTLPAGAAAARTSASGTARLESDASWTIRSISTPTGPGGPVLKQVEAI